MTPAASIRYEISFPERQRHYVAVEAAISAGATDWLDLMMAVWTPGSYLIREYSRFVEGPTAATAAGRPLVVRKTRKNRWQVATGGEPEIRIAYRIYCHDMSVRGNWVDASFALLNGAPTFLTLGPQRPPAEPAAGASRPPVLHEVAVRLPPDWSDCKTSLPSAHAAAPGDGIHRYAPVDFDTLVDSPLLAGNAATYEFSVGDRRHFLVNEGESGIWDGGRAAQDLARIVATQHRFWGHVPYDSYYFFNVISEGTGGLEHKNSTVLMTSRWKYRARKGYLDWLGLASHEFFHTWNVKRLRPIEFDAIDYEGEVHTTSLWIAEGITTYYADLLVHRAGLNTAKELLERLSAIIERLQTTPGRLAQSLEDASFDAWIKLYRPDENSSNTSISYYVKGAVVAFLLDVKIRKCTGDGRSLDDVLRLAYERYSQERGYSGEAFAGLICEVSGEDLSAWLETVLRSKAELDYEETLDYLGLRFRVPDCPAPDAPPANGGFELSKSVLDWLGVGTVNEGGCIFVNVVRAQSAAARSGIEVNDEILAVDGYRVTGPQWAARWEQYKPGQRARLLVARREKIVEIPMTIGDRSARTWQLEPDPNAGLEQERHRRRWLAGNAIE